MLLLWYSNIVLVLEYKNKIKKLTLLKYFLYREKQEQKNKQAKKTKEIKKTKTKTKNKQTKIAIKLITPLTMQAVLYMYILK